MSNRRELLKKLFIGAALGASVSPFSLLAKDNKERSLKEKKVKSDGQQDRKYWAELLYTIANPVIENMAKGTLKKNMTIEKSPTFDNRPLAVVYIEAVGRTLAGVAPWLNLEDDHTKEGKLRKSLREKAVLGLKNVFDPNHVDYLDFSKAHQPIVDAAYLSHAFYRAPKALWEPLSTATKQNIIKNFKSLRDRKPWDSNWQIFGAITEAFLLSIGEDTDSERLTRGVSKIEGWYIGDGWYSDGPKFAFDYYNSFVIHPMLLDTLDMMVKKGKAEPERHDLALKRMQRYAFQQERMISPEGTYPVVGRSITYRTAAFQALAQIALMEKLPEDLKPAQVRCALTKVMRNMFSSRENFDDKGFLTLGFAGHQPDIADYYTATGSLYMATLGFLPLGLPAANPFWTDPAADWTSKKAWAGMPFEKDYHVKY